MIGALLLVALAQAPAQQMGTFNRSREAGRVRGREGVSLAFFEAFPAGGAGTSGPCSTTAPTGARGEVLTFTRGSSATCTATATGGLVTSGIAVGDLRTLSTNVPRVEFDGASVPGLRVESAGTSDSIQSESLDNVAWTSTATVTANAATPPNNTSQISNAEQLSDVSGAAFQGSCQIIATVSATQHTFFAHVRAGTATAAQVTMTGTGSATGDCSATVTGLSGTTWNVLSCSSPAAYAGTLTAVTVCVNVGSVVGDTGTIMAWGADHKNTAPYRTSYIPTTTIAVARAAESAGFPGAAWPVSPVSFASSVTTAWSGTATAADLWAGNIASNSGWGFGWTGGTLRSQPCAAGACATLDVVQGPTALTLSRWAVSYSGTTTSIYKDAALIAGPTVKTAPNSPWATNTTFGSGVQWGWLNGIITRICIDADPARCR